MCDLCGVDFDAWWARYGTLADAKTMMRISHCRPLAKKMAQFVLDTEKKDQK